MAGLSRLDIELQHELIQKKHSNLYRYRDIIASPQGSKVIINGNTVINFSSNDYLGLANHPAVVNAFKKAADTWGVGSGSAHLICGHSTSHQNLEQELAEFTGRDRVLLFSTGYMANIGILSALLKPGDQVFEDRLNHASLLDGGLLSGAKFKRFLHNNYLNLQDKITPTQGRRLIVTDGVFSMDGDLALLPELTILSKKNHAYLLVDDAHGLGVLGATGAGILQYYALTQKDVPILMGTLGKSFGTFGAFVAGSEALIETLIQKSRTYMFTTALPSALTQATRKSLEIITKESWRRDKLNHLISRFRVGAKQLGLPIMQTITAIQPLLIGECKKVIKLRANLLKQGFLVSAIRPPAVPKGLARLRITFSANHKTIHVDRLLDALSATIKSKLW